MYTSYFGLTEKPFNLTPDPRYLFLSQKHHEALSHLRYGINERKGFIVVTGNIGTGKTTLVRVLLSELDQTVKTALIFNTFVSEAEILQAINKEFGLNGDSGLTKKQCIDQLNEFLLETFRNRGNAVLFLDEAQNLSPEVLEQIRMLSNLETEKEKLLQIVFIGQSEFNDLLAMPALKQLDERITVRYDLDPLDKKDVKAYVEHRLTVAGAKGAIKFTSSAYKVLFESTNGNPRLINAIADRALLIAYTKDKFTINKGIMEQAALNVQNKGTFHFRKNYGRPFSYTLVFLTFIILSFIGGWIFKESLQPYFINVKRYYNLESHEKDIVLPVTVKQTSEPNVKAPETFQTAAKTTIQTDTVRILPETSPPKTSESSTQAITQITSQPNDPTKTLLSLTSPTQLSDFSNPNSISEMTETKTDSNVINPDSDKKSFIPTDSSVTIQSPDTNTDMTSNIISDMTSNNSNPTSITSVSVSIVTSTTITTSITPKTLQLDMETEIPKDLNSEKLPDYMNSLKAFMDEPWETKMSTAEIMWVQKTLKNAGYSVQMTGIYDETTMTAVKQLQKNFGLTEDGIIGPQSKWALFQIAMSKKSE